MSKNIVIVGATSAIAQAVARRYAVDGATLYLLARDAEQLSVVENDLKARGALSVHQAVFDAGVDLNVDALATQASACLGRVDVVLIAYGSLPDQIKAQSDHDYAAQQLLLNGHSVVLLMESFAGVLDAQGHGTLAVISSVAGDRGRQSNYVYGAAKAMVSTYAAGLRNRLAKKGVHVVTIKPGFVDTPMTASFDKGPLWASPDKVAADICKAISKGKNVCYTPWFWRGIMNIIRHIPEPIFKKLSL